MKIKNISCTQFAGIRDRNINFTDGVNVIYGKNESGKSTIVNLISRTLFQNSRIDNRSNKDFRDLYFPAAVKGKNTAGDCADGKISFDTENGTYTLLKEWGTEPRCSLSTPDGVIKDQKTIDLLLKDILVYGEGVYADMLLSSQRNTDTALQTILDSKVKTDAKQEITNTVSQAFAESGGISLDEIERKINTKIEEIGGKHWDFEKEAPKRNPRGGRYEKELGEILKAYYALEKAKSVLDEISSVKDELDHVTEKYSKADAEVKIAENAYNDFNTYASKLVVQSERKKSIARIENELNKISNILAEWPETTEKTEQAKVLQKEKKNRELLDKYESAKKIAEELNSIDKSLLERSCPTDSELAQIKKAQRGVTKLENSLCGMNLSAAINLFGGHTLEITSLRTGKKIDFSNGNAEITEAVKITIPDVVELQLSPSDIDVSAVEAEISEQKKILTDIFEKYSVENADELENLAKEISTAKTKFESVESRLNILLEGGQFDELENNAKNISTSVRSKKEIENDILGLCVTSDISKFITAKETVIAGFVQEYKSVAELKAKAYDLENEYNRAKDVIESIENIPEEYLHIDNPEAHLEILKTTLKGKQEKREALLTEKTTVAGKLEAYNEKRENDPKEDVEKAERIFNETKSLLKHWLHISEVFKAQKEKMNNNPMQDIANSFTRYLGLISSSKISSEFPDADKLNMDIYSNNRKLDYSKLSEGTKETVSLAFRLAVLDHLFPSGGVIVLDDPFTDMDAERAKQSCMLVNECAKKHQVIFLTCREEYLDMLSGNEIVI